MVSVVETAVLGIIQGLTEWLPVSSSGHLAIAKELVGWHPPVIFYVLLHVSTLFVIIAFFRQSIIKILKALLNREWEKEDAKLGVFVVAGNVPTAIVGFLLRDLFKSFFSNLLVVGTALIATGCLLFVSERREGRRTLGFVDSLLIGIAQGISIVPGISRSGATISTGLLRKIDRKKAFKFSFLLSIPPIIGATIVESGDLELLLSGGDIIPLATGIAASMLVGYLSLKVLREAIVRRRFHLFSLYCCIAGALVVISQVTLLLSE